MDKYTIAANVTINDLDGFYGKLAATVQRDIFGAELFGKKSVDITTKGQGSVEVTWRASGANSDKLFKTVSFAEIADAVNAGKMIQFS